MQLRVEQILKMQDRQLFNLLLEFEIEELLRTPPPLSAHFQLVDTVRNKISKIMIYDMGMDSFIMISSLNNWILTTGGISGISRMSGDRYLPLMLKNTNNNVTWYADFIPKNDIVLNAYNRWLMPDTIKLIRTYPILGQEILGYISVSIPCAWFSRILASDEFAKDILLVDEAGRIIANKRGNMHGVFLADSLYGADLAGKLEKEESGFIQNSSSNLLYSFSASAFNGWRYIYISDLHVASQAISVLRNTTLGLGLFIFLAVVIVSFIRTRFFYRPVNKLYAKLAEETTGFTDNARNEFGVMYAHLEEILQKRRELEQMVMSQSQLGRELFLHKLLNGEIAGDDLDEKIKLYDFPACPEYCRVILMQFESLEDTGYDKTDRDWLSVALSNIAAELMDNYLCFPIVLDGGSIVMVAGMSVPKQDFKTILARRLEKLLEIIHQTIHVDAVICVSANAANYGKLSDCRAIAYGMFKYQLRYSQNGILFAEDMEEAPVAYTQFPQRLEEDILQAIRQYDVLKTESALKVFICYVLEHEDLRRSCYLNFFRLLVDILRIAQEYNLEQDWLMDQGSVFEQLFLLKSWSQIHGWFKKNFIDPLLCQIYRRISRKENILIQDMKKIAETRYEEYLSVEIVAEELSSYPSYLRRVFKSGTGMAFSTYLTNCRMDAAKGMLEKTDMLVSDIAKRLTYQNSQNFIRTFRSQTGVTPGEYRKLKGEALE
jgi:AraC-like DNA-binding protein